MHSTMGIPICTFIKHYFVFKLIYVYLTYCNVLIRNKFYDYDYESLN